MSTTTAQADAAMSEFEATTTRWGQLTMVIGLICSLIGPAYLVFFADLGVDAGDVMTAFVAVAATFAVFWILEPVTYFPVLGPAAMYQAFMIGNISNKLLPAAVVAQSSTDSKPGTRRGDLAAVMAICGAATVHLTTLLVFVGILGTWLIQQIPADTIAVARIYILPAVMGAVLVQTIWTLRQARITVIALAVAFALQFGLLALFPSTALYTTALAVAITVALSWVLRDRAQRPADAEAEVELSGTREAEGRR